MGDDADGSCRDGGLWPQAAGHVYEAQQQQRPPAVLQRARRIELDDESSSHGEESAMPTPAKDCTTATPQSS